MTKRVAVELIICTNDKRWNTHYEFIEEDNFNIAEEISISQFVDKLQSGEIDSYKESEITFIGVLESKEVKI